MKAYLIQGFLKFDSPPMLTVSDYFIHANVDFSESLRLKRFSKESFIRFRRSSRVTLFK